MKRSRKINKRTNHVQKEREAQEIEAAFKQLQKQMRPLDKFELNLEEP